MKPLLLCTAFFLAGCATVPPSDGGGTEPFRALGTEPFWSVTVADDRVTFESPEGPPVIMPLISSVPRGEGRRYATSRMTMDVVPGECSDGMSDRRYAERVTVVMDGRRLEGCGGDIIAPAGLAGTAWSIVEIDGRPVSGQAYHLQFEQDRLSGQAGCNRFSGTFIESEGRIVAGPLMSTRMACPEPAMTHERRVLDLLGEPVSFEHPDGDSLLLSGPSGSVRLRRSI